MYIFLDTEFTSLDRPRLISLALVPESGSSLYYELGGWTRFECSVLTRDAVIPQLSGREHQITPADLPERLVNWLEAFEEPLRIVCDDPERDFALFAGLFPQDEEAWPFNLDRTCLRFDFSDREDSWDSHHALRDAQRQAEAFRLARSLGWEPETGLWLTPQT